MLARRRSLLQLTLVALLFATTAGCPRSPVTGQRQLVLISEAQEIAMGQQAAQQVAAQIGLVPDSALQAYVQQMGAQMAAGTERPALPWTFGVVDDPTPNAFALPGGYIFFTRGLLTLLTTEAQLASVLGHEIGHVTARHSVVAISRAQIAQLGLGVGMIIVPELQAFGGIAAAGLELLFLRHSREAERQADELGFRYALAQGFDVREMPDVFAALARVGDAAGQSPLPAWLLTHPEPGERIARTRALAAELPQPVELRSGREAYLAHIDGMIFGRNPRHGVFDGPSFLHPDLRFRMEFPLGWNYQNMPQVVMAGPRENDAAIQLTLTDGAADRAAQRFIGQTNVVALPPGPRRETIHGNPAVWAEFEAATQQGVLRGVAMWVEYQGRTYQLLGISTAPRFQHYAGAFNTSLRSFRALTDPRFLDLQPNRVRTVRITESMTLAQFNQRYPSAVPIETLALINQVDGATSMLPAGTRIKRVTQ